jgi:CBS domain-containing protein
MLSSTSTKTLPYDTYPIRVAPDSVTGGTVFLAAEDHAGIVSHIVMDGSTTHPVQTLEAGSPTRVQKLNLRNLILPNPSGDNISGLLKFRWPIKTGGGWHYLPVKDHPFYSEEQYSSAFIEGYGNYLEAIAMRIDPKVYDPNEKVEKIINTLTRRLKQRIPIVLDGNKKCHEIQCPARSRFWEIYSTPARDEFIGIMVDHLDEIIKKNHLDRDAIIDKMAKINLQISPGQSITLQYVFQNFQWLSSDPEASIEARWGLDKCSIISIHLKSARESISFIQKKYRNTDPQFSEREIRIQQEIVDKMTRESQKNNCAIGSR